MHFRAVLGSEKVDLHSGGQDLKFPHHDNEIAQSEVFTHHLRVMFSSLLIYLVRMKACHNHHQWVNYFLHCGHLGIHGQKMAKSLKNFTTIKTSLKQYSGRQIRMLCLLHKYNLPMDYSEDAMKDAVHAERLFRVARSLS